MSGALPPPAKATPFPQRSQEEYLARLEKRLDKVSGSTPAAGGAAMPKGAADELRAQRESLSEFELRRKHDRGGWDSDSEEGEDKGRAAVQVNSRWRWSRLASTGEDADTVDLLDTESRASAFEFDLATLDPIRPGQRLERKGILHLCVLLWRCLSCKGCKRARRGHQQTHTPLSARE